MNTHQPTCILKLSLIKISYATFMLLFMVACNQKDIISPDAVNSGFIGTIDGSYVKDVPDGSALRTALGNHFKDFIAANFSHNGKNEIKSREIVKFGEDFFIKTNVAFSIGKPSNIYTKLKKDLNSHLVVTPLTLVCTNSYNCPGNGCVLQSTGAGYTCYCSLGTPGTAACLLIAEE